MRIVFFGSSDFSLHALKACLDASLEISLVITTPPRRKGRGLELSATPVQAYCVEKNLPVEAPETLKEEVLLERVRKLAPDLFIVSSYGKLIPSAWLSIPAVLNINVHPSLLPKYRGAAPINWPILNGDVETGVSIADVTSKLDAGDVYRQVRVPLPPDADAVRMTEFLGKLSAEVLRQVLEDVQSGRLNRTPQDDAASSYARKLSREDGLLGWDEPAEILARKVRGLSPWPGTYFVMGGEPVHVLEARVVPQDGVSPGVIALIDHSGGLVVATPMQALVLDKVKPAGKREMSGADFARGRRLRPGMPLA